MSSLYNVAILLHAAFVVLFVAVTGLLLAVSILRRSRMKRVRLSWSNGPLFGLPLIPSLFLAIVVGLIGYEVSFDESTTSIGSLLLIGYLTGGVFWYVAALLSASVTVTDWGVSRKTHGRSEAIPWHEVTDYLVHADDRKTTYVFFRLNDRGRKQRFELEVPRSRRADFGRLVESKLDARFNYHVRKPAGKRALKQ
jgi:energy-converting hydrogenase Eha subunit A